jgi:hypothetical protein
MSDLQIFLMVCPKGHERKMGIPETDANRFTYCFHCHKAQWFRRAAVKN